MTVQAGNELLNILPKIFAHEEKATTDKCIYSLCYGVAFLLEHISSASLLLPWKISVKEEYGWCLSQRDFTTTGVLRGKRCEFFEQNP